MLETMITDSVNRALMIQTNKRKTTIQRTRDNILYCGNEVQEHPHISNINSHIMPDIKSGLAGWSV